MQTEIEQYYNKFNEEKRLDRRHGRVEFITSMKYIHQCLGELARQSGRKPEEIRIMDIGAGTGKYSVALSEEGYDVTAVELVRHNLGLLKAKKSNVKAYQGNAVKLSRFADGTFDLTLLFGPLYHLHAKEDKLKALSEAKRITKKGGFILAAYIMNEYGVISYAFKERNIFRALSEGMLDGSFHCTDKANPLYSFMRLEDIGDLNRESGLERVRIIAADGAANYMRREMNALTEEEFERFIEYHLSTCERSDLMGATSHTVDILRKISN
ncbi:MAG: methyltransferase domain-containing protein [Alistipes sp.]|nr:methyltransferase domain-containing protein [Alistipes sp.]